MIDDGLQPPVTLTSPHREIIAATYYTFVQRNIGEWDLIICFSFWVTEFITLTHVGGG